MTNLTLFLHKYNLLVQKYRNCLCKLIMKYQGTNFPFYTSLNGNEINPNNNSMLI